MIGTLLLAFFTLIALMIIHEYGHFIIAKKFGARIDEFGIGYPPRIFGKKFGETIYSVNLIPLGAFVRIYGEEGGVDDYRSFGKLSIWKRILISAAFMIGASVPIGDQDVVGVTDTTIRIIDVRTGSPAEAAGIKKGDVLVGVNKLADFQQFIDQNKGKEVSLDINRNGQALSVQITPRLVNPEGQGPTGVVLERVADVIKKYSWWQAPIEGVWYTGKVTVDAMKGIFNFFGSLFSGQGVPQGAELAGPVGITIFMSQAASLGAGFFLYFIGSLSVLLAIFNLFPIPALDGGKLVFLLIEAVRKKPVSLKIEQSLTIVCFVLLITMSLFITIRFDIPRIINLWNGA